MACDGGNGMMDSMQMDKEKELLRQQPHQQQLQLPGAAAPTPWILPQAPQPSQQSVEAQQLPLLSPPREVGGDEREEVIVSKNVVVEIGGVVACDGEKEMMVSMQMDTQEELLQQQPNEQQPELFGAAAPDPWPPPMSADPDESNSEWEIGRHDFLVFALGGRPTAGRVRLGNAKRRELRAIARRMEANVSEKVLALVGPSASSGVGGPRRLVGALPVRGEHVYAKRGDLTTRCRDQKARIIFKYLHRNSSIKTCLLVE